MNKHACIKCEQYEHCTHIRESIRHYDPIDRYGYFVTYVGGYAVLTTVGLYCPETLVLSVGPHTLGDIIDRPVEEQQKRIMYRVIHDWDFFLDHHDFAVMGLHEKMLELSK